jgi:hypothetical protein
MFPSIYQKNVSYYAHGFGFLFGVLYGLMSCSFMTPQTKRHEYLAENLADGYEGQDDDQTATQEKRWH